MKNLKRLIFAACLVGLLSATAVFGFSISPLKYLLTVAPGTTRQTVNLTVTNDSDSARQFALKVIGAKQNENGKLTYASGNTPAEEWVKPAESTIEIPGKTEKEVKYIINVPIQAAAGSYYLGLAVETASGGGAVGLSGQLIAPLLLQVAGVVNESLRISDWHHPALVLWKNHWSYQLSFENKGNVEVPVEATIILRDWRGKEIQKKELNLGDIILPGSGRAFESEIKLPYGDFYLPGPYSAELKVKYGRTSQAATAFTDIWYFPAYSFLALAVLILIGIYIWWKKKKHD